MDEPRLLERAVNDLQRSLLETLLIGILDPQDEIPPSCLAIRYVYRAVLKFPTCIRPVGLGANLVLTLAISSISPYIVHLFFS